MRSDQASRPNAPLLRIQDAAFGYRGTAILRHVDLEIEVGAFVGVVGPNGSGKTTLFRGLLGLLPPLAGSVERDDVPVGYVPQREQLDAVFPLTVEELVQMGGYARLSGLRRLPTTEKDEARRCLEEVDLETRARHLFSSLSGGQRQRALIARALMVRPRVLLLDEPTSGVDRRASRQVLELLDRLNRERGLAVLLVAHQFDIVRRYAHEVIWVADGEVVRGSPGELLAPAAIDERLAGSSACTV